ncbi:MAG TPA: hypothetical protein VL069_08240, partial [Opitutus sp.]|nr:hypothetical protein [Opitutus sp.]
EFIQAGKVGIEPGVFVPVAEPADPSSRYGLNEYTVTLERLPAGESPDFGWQAVSGVNPTKPPTSTKPNPKISTKVSQPGSTAKTSAVTKLTAKAKVSASAAAGAAVNVGDIVATGPAFQIKPLWEGDVRLPASTDDRPRRLVIRENELYFKATPKPNEFLPIARRLVYVDIVELPAPVA